MSEEKNKPVMTYRVGRVSATIWAKEVDDKFSQTGKRITFTTVIAKSYKDGEQWNETSNFYVEDLPKVVLASQLAYEYTACKVEG